MTSNNHVQAEALAAWAEGRLAAAEAATVEAHLASCALCQETLAVFARTEPVTRLDPSVVSGFGWFRWRWAVPVAAAATAAAIWVAVPDNPNRDEFERTVAPAIEERSVAPGRAASADAEAPPAEPQAKPLSSRRDAAIDRLEDRAAKQESRAAANAVEEDRKAEASPAAPPAAARAPEAPPASDQGRFRAETLSGVQRQAAAVAEVVSPDPLVRWRIVPPGRLERSTDGGKTWVPVTLPQPIDVIAVRAPTATSAIATAADGREFRTEDQGKTWTP